MMTQTTEVAKEYTLYKRGGGGEDTNFEYIQIYNTPPSYNLFMLWGYRIYLSLLI